MDDSAIKSMMNPVRIKIVQELTLQKEATTKELQEACGDVPQATLYRHLAVLEKHDIIQVASYNQVRGIREKVYTIKTNPSVQINKEIKKLTREDLSALFSQFSIGLLSDVENYLKKEDAIEKIQHSLGFQSQTVLVTDEELLELMKEINEVIQKRMSNKASIGRKLRKISHVVTTS